MCWQLNELHGSGFLLTDCFQLIVDTSRVPLQTIEPPSRDMTPMFSVCSWCPTILGRICDLRDIGDLIYTSSKRLTTKQGIVSIYVQSRVRYVMIRFVACENQANLLIKTREASLYLERNCLFYLLCRVQILYVLIPHPHRNKT